MHENTPPAPMDEEPSQGNEDGTWFPVARKRKKQAQAESNLPHNIEPTHQGQTQPMFRKKSSLLPPLPIGDLKVVFRPRDGLNLGEWPQHSIARAIGMATQFTDATLHQLTIRIRRQQNVAVVSTPDDDLAAILQQIKVLCLANKQYEVQAYVAAPDVSCKGVIFGIEKKTSPTTLMTQLRSPTAQILHARMMGGSATAIITFSGTQVPRYIYYYGAEYRCHIHRPRQQLCGVCLSTGHRADVCPTPDKPRRAACGSPSPPENHECTPKCITCGGEHPATDSRCPARQRKPFNKSHVRREQKRMAENLSQEEGQPGKVTSFNLEATNSTAAAPHRSRNRSRSHSKGRSRSWGRSHSGNHKHPRGQSHSASRINNRNQHQHLKQPQVAWTKTSQHPKVEPSSTGTTTTSVSCSAQFPPLSSGSSPSSQQAQIAPLHAHAITHTDTPTPTVDKPATHNYCPKREVREMIEEMGTALRAEMQKLKEGIMDDVKHMLQEVTKQAMNEMKQFINASLCQQADCLPHDTNSSRDPRRSHSYARPVRSSTQTLTAQALASDAPSNNHGQQT
ncbi:hypothetical protein HPB50_012517 [Hyalomma asiaticum]|uniref:Uncharacterized protein n=1 Tax=Hyalomma asiaticum TaxID=266040 RepID=A0ACB7RP87_HYAAI|nr:hypothetical protein HPB50_012517 [Hyalomma asiaticum]